VIIKELNNKVGVIKVALNLFGAAEFVMIVKKLCLPAKEADDDVNNCHTMEQKQAVQGHKIMIFHLSLSFQNNSTLLNYINGSKNPAWPAGRSWVVFVSIKQYVKLTPYQISKTEVIITKQRAMEDMLWQRNSNVYKIWKNLEDLRTIYSKSIVPIMIDELVVWIHKNQPIAYNNMIDNVPILSNHHDLNKPVMYDTYKMYINRQ